MTSVTCCLCGFTCLQYRILYDDNGKTNEVYKIAAKFFDSSLLDAETKSMLRVICIECWQHISNFHSFQNWIINAQTQQEDFKFVILEEKPSELISTSHITDINLKNNVANDVKLSDSMGFLDKRDDICFSEMVSNFQCQKCKKHFQSDVTLNEHFQLCHSVICLDKNFNGKFNIVENEVAKDNFSKSDNRSAENCYKCERCGASFSQYGNLRRHIRKKHVVQPLLKWMCKYCKKVFKTRSHLERHKNTDHNCQFSDDSENIAKEKLDKKCKTDAKLEDVKLCEGNKSTKYNAKDSVSIESRRVINNHQDLLKYSCNSILVPEEVSSANVELTIAMKYSGTEINSNMQIQMPVLDIVDIKSEIFTDIESDDTSRDGNNFKFNQLKSEEEYDNFLTNWKGNFECPRCSQQVKNYFILCDHFKLKHPEERCYISCCHILLYDRRSIAEHLQFHENPNIFECSDCGKCFKNRKGLRSHKLQVHTDNRSNYHLHLCYCKRAQERRAVKIPEGEEIEYDMLVCCQRKKKILQDDALIAKWKKELTCEICNTTFSYYSLMRAHFYREHPGERCNIYCCHRKMSRISDALEHIRFHLDPHAYRCEICNTDFSAKNTLAKHMRNAHRDSLPKHRWSCDECDKTFEIRQILTRHKNVCHSK